ncbi:hypothetical protein RhiirA1_463759, partial [Rhizophagus irregularis]
HFTVINHITFIFPITVSILDLCHYNKILDDFDKLNNQTNSSKINSIFKVGSKKLSKIFKKNDIQETTQQQMKKYHDNINDDEIHNNPNLHSEGQDELELPDNIDE